MLAPEVVVASLAAFGEGGVVVFEAVDGGIVGCADEEGAAVARLGIPASEIFDEREALIISVNGIAERFREVFHRHFWEPYVERACPPRRCPPDNGRQPTH